MTTRGRIRCVDCDTWHEVIDGRVIDCPWTRKRERSERLREAAPEMLALLKDFIQATEHRTVMQKWRPDGLAHAIYAARALLARIEQ